MKLGIFFVFSGGEAKESKSDPTSETKEDAVVRVGPRLLRCCPWPGGPAQKTLVSTEVLLQ